LTTEVGFYQLSRTTLEQALPRLLERILSRGWRCVLRTASMERLEQLDRHLWAYERESFLPHGSHGDGAAEMQPIWLTTRVERPNQAQALVLVDAAPLTDAGAYLRVLDLFDARERDSVALARERWRTCRKDGHLLRFWQQSDNGSWELVRETAPTVSYPGHGESDGGPSAE
jgi:DNA polymerase III subunit chi